VGVRLGGQADGRRPPTPGLAGAQAHGFGRPAPFIRPGKARDGRSQAVAPPAPRSPRNNPFLIDTGGVGVAGVAIATRGRRGRGGRKALAS